MWSCWLSGWMQWDRINRDRQVMHGIGLKHSSKGVTGGHEVRAKLMLKLKLTFTTRRGAEHKAKTVSMDSLHYFCGYFCVALQDRTTSVSHANRLHKMYCAVPYNDIMISLTPLTPFLHRRSIYRKLWWARATVPLSSARPKTATSRRGQTWQTAWLRSSGKICWPGRWRRLGTPCTRDLVTTWPCLALQKLVVQRKPLGLFFPSCFDSASPWSLLIPICDGGGVWASSRVFWCVFIVCFVFVLFSV